MDTVASLLVLSTLLQLGAPGAPSATELRATVEIVTGASRIFTGETVRLRCHVQDEHGSVWNYQWFRDTKQLPQTEQVLVLWNTKMDDGGNYYCQGVRKTVVGNIYTLQSLPVEINVDGGWAILQAPPHPALVGDTLSLLCRIRGKPPIHETILYKDGVEVMRQDGPNLRLTLTNLNLEDEGMYSCRASWDVQRRTHSIISVAIHVQVLEVLTQPIVEIVSEPKLIAVNKMKVICHVQYNARAPAPPINFYFYKNEARLGPATSENHDLVRPAPGQYSCRAKVPELGLSKWSEPKTFEQIRGAHMAHPRGPSTHLSPNPAPQQRVVQHSKLSPASVQYTKEPSQPPLKPSQPSRPSTVDHALTPAAPPTSDLLPSHGYTAPPLTDDSVKSPNPPLKLEAFQPFTPTATPSPGTESQDSSDLSAETF